MNDIERSANAMKGVYASREEWAENIKKILKDDNIIGHLNFDSIRAKGEQIMPNKDRLAGVVDRLCEPTEEYADALQKQVEAAIAKLPKGNPCVELDLPIDDALAKMVNAGFIAETLQEFAQNKYDAHASVHRISHEQWLRWADMEAKGAQTIRQLLHLIEQLRTNNG
jgi:hypothetical protein